MSKRKSKKNTQINAMNPYALIGHVKKNIKKKGKEKNTHWNDGTEKNSIKIRTRTYCKS